jgi:hypothetical protein
MTDTWWPKRGAARKSLADESKGTWSRSLRSLWVPAEEVLGDVTDIHRMGAPQIHSFGHILQLGREVRPQLIQ